LEFEQAVGTPLKQSRVRRNVLLQSSFPASLAAPPAAP